MRHITNESMTVKDAKDFLAYDEFMYEREMYHDPMSFDTDLENEFREVDYNAAHALVDDYNTLVTLIKERFGGAIGKVDFKVVESYNAEQINQMIDNYLESELVA